MKMFDWDDQEIANILWGEGREADDHIVPYPEDTERKDLRDYEDNDMKILNEEDTNKKDAEKRQTTSKLLSDGEMQEKNDGVFTSGIVMDPQLDSPSFATSKIDDNPIAKKSELHIGPEVTGNQQEDKELGELVGHNWANIGSFDDLVRIFSNDELDGHSSLGSADALWSSSKDLVRDADNSSSAAIGLRSWEYGELGNSSSQIQLNSEYLLEEDTAGSSALIEEKRYWPKSQPKLQQATDTITNSALSRNVYDTWSSSPANISYYDHLCAPSTIPNFPAEVPSQQWLSEEAKPIAYQPLANTRVTRMLKPSQNEQRFIQANSEVCRGDVVSFNKPVEITERPMKMTPQEKIEKLRRRQQMRAMLAIQKQQQQLSHQASYVDYPLTRKSCQEEQFLHIERAELEADESLRNLPCCDPGSLNKKDDLCTVSGMDVYSVEDTVLCKLQNIIARLDTKTRLCIRDSLYRLAHNVTQRHLASDTNAANRSTTSNPEIANEEINGHHRIAGNATVETDTNHIDRAVAHLLFHRPLKISVKHAETPESSTPKTPRPFVDSSLEDMQDISQTTNTSVNPQRERKMAD